MNQIFKHGYALLIGVGADLPTTVKDANAIYDILIDSQRCAYPINQVKVLTEKQANRQGIFNGLDWLINKIQSDPEAMVIVYYSGHGWYVPNYHLLPYNYDENDITHTAVSGAEFTEKLQKIQTKKLLVLLDCCHASGMVKVKSGFTKGPIPPELENILHAGSGRFVIASSRKNESSLILKGESYSEFTRALLKGLAGYGASENNGYAYLADIAMYIGRVVPNRTKKKQHPTLEFADADNFAIAYYAGGGKSPKSLPNIDKKDIILSTKNSVIFLIIAIFLVILFFWKFPDDVKYTETQLEKEPVTNIKQDIGGGIGVINTGSGSVSISSPNNYDEKEKK